MGKSARNGITYEKIVPIIPKGYPAEKVEQKEKQLMQVLQEYSH